VTGSPIAWNESLQLFAISYRHTHKNTACMPPPSLPVMTQRAACACPVPLLVPPRSLSPCRDHFPSRRPGCCRPWRVVLCISEMIALPVQCVNWLSLLPLQTNPHHAPPLFLPNRHLPPALFLSRPSTGGAPPHHDRWWKQYVHKAIGI